MNIKRLSLLIIPLLLSSCLGTEFLGAKKYNRKGGYYVERWFANPDYSQKIQSGTAFYGAAAEKIKHRFIIKYYKADHDGDSVVEIPKKDMWVIKHNGKRYNYQDDENLFFYTKTKIGLYVKEKAIPTEILMPVKNCKDTNWCQLYITNSRVRIKDEQLYIKKSILIKHL